MWSDGLKTYFEMVFSQISIFELFTNNNMIAAELQNCKVYYNVHR